MFILRGSTPSGRKAGRRNDHLVGFLMIFKDHSHDRRPNYERSTRLPSRLAATGGVFETVAAVDASGTSEVNLLNGGHAGGSW